MAGDPNLLSDIIDVAAVFIPASANGRFGFTDPLAVAAFASSASFPTQLKSYTGKLSQKQQLLINDGFLATSATYRQVTAMGAQKSPPRTIWVGRRDAGDADWPAALDAIKAEAALVGANFYAIAVDTRNVFDIEDIDAWVETKFALYIAQTDNAAVLNNTPGNVAELILAKNHSRTAMFWHDPSTASNLGGAVLTSVAGTFNVADATELKLRVDGGAEQVFDFNSTAALILGSIAAPWVFADGDALSVAIDSGVTQVIAFATTSAVLTSGAVETFDIVPNTQLSSRVDGGAVELTTFDGTAGTLDTGADTFALVDTETVTFNIDGTGNQIVTFNTVDFVAIAAATAEEVAAVYAAALTGVTISDDGSVVTVSSTKFGTSSDVEIVAGDAASLAALGYIVGNNVGTGFAAFLDVATAAEVFAQINTDTTGLVASASVGGAVVLTADSVGTASRVQVTGGLANDVLLFSTNEVAGTGDFSDATAATAAEVLTVLANNLDGATSIQVAGAIQLTSRTRGTGSKIEIFASTVATTLGLAVSVVSGIGDFFNAAVATPSEISTHIGLTLADASSTVVSNAIVLTTDSSGTASELQITGGSLQSVLLFTDSAGNADRARGTGTDEDYLDCALIGRCITADLDRPSGNGGGQITWDNRSLNGVFADRDINNLANPTRREVLHDTLQVLTYENRNGRNETHFGTLLNDQLGAGRYIDVRTSLDWLHARLVEDLKRPLDAVADLDGKIPYRDTGPFDLAMRERAKLSANNGHTILDLSVLDPDDPTSTGILTPTIAGQTQTDINNRKVDGYRMRQETQGAAQRVGALIELIGPVSSV